MRNNRNRAVVAGLLAVLLSACTEAVFPALSEAPAESKQSAAPPADHTPEKSFVAALKAHKKGDWKSSFALCDDFPVNLYTGQLVGWYAMKFLASPEDLQAQPLEEKR
jgi:hypothetical protein